MRVSDARGLAAVMDFAGKSIIDTRGVDLAGAFSIMKGWRKEGRIFADGPKHELITAEKLRELFGVEVNLVEHDGGWHSW